MTEDQEKIYESGFQAAYLSMWKKCRSELSLTSEQKNLAMLESEREDVVLLLRRICAEFGDNDWDKNLHLVDILEKHLFVHVLDR